MTDFSDFDFAPVMNYPQDLYVFDLTESYDPEYIRTKPWAIGKYNEKRTKMYTAVQYEGERNIHVGVDIWTDSGAPVFSFYDGTLTYKENHAQQGNYGPTLVVGYEIGEVKLYALYGHLSLESLNTVEVGESIDKGQKIAELGEESVNGGWAPHLHFQLSVRDPGGADMPGVVADDFREEALKIYPDPRIVLGDIY